MLILPMYQMLLIIYREEKSAPAETPNSPPAPHGSSIQGKQSFMDGEDSTYTMDDDSAEQDTGMAGGITSSSANGSSSNIKIHMLKTSCLHFMIFRA